MHFMVLCIAVVLLLGGCGSRTEEVRNALPATTDVPSSAASTRPSAVPATPPVSMTVTSVSPEKAGTSPARTPTTPKPTATSQPERKPLALKSSGFGQKDRHVNFALVIANPNSGVAISRSQFQVAIYEKSGAVAKTDSGYIDLVLPGQTMGVAGDVILPENVTADRIDVQLKSGTPEATQPLPGLSVDRVAYLPDKNFPKAAAIIKSPYQKDVTDLKISTVAYDTEGKIIGGGYTYLNFVLANSEAPVMMSVVTSGEPAKVEVYPALSGLSAFTGGSGNSAPKPLTVAAQGFGQSGQQAGFGFVVKNPYSDQAIENTMYHAAAYAEDGSVLGVEEGFIELLLPDQQLGVGNDLGLPAGTKAAKLDVQVKAGKLTKSEHLPSFMVDNVNYKADRFSSMVTGIVKSPYQKDVKNLRVSALTYDEKGNITGGGFTFLDFVLANGQAPVEVSVKHSGKPARVELYPVLSGLSSFESK